MVYKEVKSLKKPRILVVEDDPAISELICMNLEITGYACDAARDGTSALTLSGTARYDIALLDIMLPGMDGFELIGHLNEAGIPVIYLSAKNDVADKVRGLRLGAEDYIVKPFAALELLVRVEKVLSRHRKSDEVLQIADVTINPVERTVRKAGEPVALKPLEFDLLVMLARNRNIALSRERLLNALWGEDYFGETRTVDVHIAQLRKKLAWGKTIVTVSKMGYRLEVPVNTFRTAHAIFPKPMVGLRVLRPASRYTADLRWRRGHDPRRNAHEGPKLVGGDGLG